MLLLPMFLRSTNRNKDGKNHRYFSIVENRRLPGDKTVQRTVLYLGEINDQQLGMMREALAKRSARSCEVVLQYPDITKFLKIEPIQFCLC